MVCLKKMPLYDQGNADVFVYTFKDGLLSAAAHDLKLRVARFRINVDDDGSGDGTKVEGSFDAGSLEVVCARKEGADAPGALPTSFFAEIERNIQRDVLACRKFPEVRFASTSVSESAVLGTLSLHGVTRTLRVVRSNEGSVRVGRVELDQREFGIQPFRALLGAMKVRADVVVEVRLRG
jgi:hypothetical protein